MSKTIHHLQKLLADVDAALSEIYGRRNLTCCGRGYGECCGEGEETWSDADQAAMNVLAPVHSELSFILIEAKAAPEPATVAVDAGALEALRSAMSKLRAPMSRAEYAVARAGIIEAAYSLLAGGGE